MHKLSFVWLLFLHSSASIAALSIPGIPTAGLNALAVTDKTLARTGLAGNEDDMLASQDSHLLKLSETQMHEAQVWGLTEDEEKRYVHLMQNRSGIYYEGLHQTPIDILGINAQSDAERTHFAELAARQEAQKISKNIAWNNAFYKAYNALYQDVPVVGHEFDPTPYSPMAYKPVALNAGDHLYLFVKPTDAIKSVLLSLINAVDNTANTQLHLMLLDVDDVSIQQWANQQHISRELVANGRVSLHHGDLNFEALTVSKKTTPLLVLARAGKSRVVDMGRF